MKKPWLIAGLLGAASCLDVLPERARHGKLADAVPGWRAKGHGQRARAFIYHAPLDHFNSSNTGTMPVRYWVDDDCHRKGGPVFVSMGGEAGAGPSDCGDREYRYGAAALSVEHRFYGESLPDVEAPLSTEYLRFLTVEQNAADTAAIVQQLQRRLNTTQAVAFGGSYSGGTCAWFRQKYPEVVTGCVSSSGVVNTAFEFPEFDTRVYEAVQSPPSDCARRYQLSTAAFERKFANGEGDAVKRLFNAANMIGTKMGDSDFFYGYTDALQQLDQYGNKKALCNGLAELPEGASDDDRIQNIQGIIEAQYGANFVNGCFYDSECLRKTVTAAGGGIGDKQWRWQKCTQVAYLQSAPERNALRSSKYLTLETLVAQCSYVFDMSPAQIRKGNADFTSAHWGKLASEGSNIFFLNFSDDPWQEASVKTTLGEGLELCMVTCDGCGHCGAGAGGHRAHCDSVADQKIAAWLAQ
eukprot:TRINITY_DN9195_c1_g2_i2.p1 TRINITY_DN9195_c1_g2~~TRINITY_DN9195_c1_g2_i2.p1  ORF type:complete len:468 (+),score=140.20 TRINITY_DN9195_c1_g2_i2:75-1478(+)